MLQNGERQTSLQFFKDSLPQLSYEELEYFSYVKELINSLQITNKLEIRVLCKLCVQFWCDSTIFELKINSLISDPSGLNVLIEFID